MAKTKYVKLFEQFEGNDQFEAMDLPRGQKAAISRGDDILTDEQYAACYLNAIQAQGRGEDLHGLGDNNLTRTALTVGGNKPEHWLAVSGAKLAAYLDLKPQTVERTVSKFKMMLDGNTEGTESNVIWPGLVDLFNQFEEMQKGEVYAMAEEAINPDPDMTEYEEYMEKTAASSKKSRDKKKDTDSKVRQEIRRVFLNLVNQFDGDLDKAARITQNSLAKSFGTTPKDIVTLARMEFKNEESLRKAWFVRKPVQPDITVGPGQEQDQQAD